MTAVTGNNAVNFWYCSVMIAGARLGGLLSRQLNALFTKIKERGTIYVRCKNSNALVRLVALRTASRYETNFPAH